MEAWDGAADAAQTPHLQRISAHQSVGLHDEINSIIAIVGLCSLSEQL